MLCSLQIASTSSFKILTLALELREISPQYAEKVHFFLKEYDSIAFQNWRLAQLKHYCMLTILSMLEGENDDAVVKTIMKNIPIGVITNMIEVHFGTYRSMYGTKFNKKAFGKVRT